MLGVDVAEDHKCRPESWQAEWKLEKVILMIIYGSVEKEQTLAGIKARWYSGNHKNKQTNKL